MSNTSLLGSFGGLGNAGLQFRNKLINGDMRIAQRGTSFTATGGFIQVYPVDRMLVSNSQANIVTSQITLTDSDSVYPEFRHASRVAVSVGNNNCAILQRVEDVQTLAGQTATFSFWAKGTNPGGGNFDIQMQQIFGSGGSAGIVTVVDTLIVTSAWKKYSVTFDVPSIAGKIVGDNSCLQVAILQPDGDTSTAAWTLDTTGWQLEAGPVATPFEHRPIGLELQLCQRYYEKSYPFSVAPGSFPYYSGRQTALGPTAAGEPLCGFSFSVTKRIRPTMAIYNPQTGDANQVRRYNNSVPTPLDMSSINATNTTNEKGVSFVIQASGSYVAGYTYDWHWTAEAEL